MLFVYTVSCGHVHMLLHSGRKANIRIIIMFDECTIELNLGMDDNVYICVAFCRVLQKHNYHSFGND